MAIYTDNRHLITTNPDLEELYKFAYAIGLKREWIQIKGRKFPHFDMRGYKRRLAKANGAIELTEEFMVELCSAINTETKIVGIVSWRDVDLLTMKKMIKSYEEDKANHKPASPRFCTDEEFKKSIDQIRDRES